MIWMLLFVAIIVAMIVVIIICFCCFKENVNVGEAIAAKAEKEFKKKVKIGGFDTEVHHVDTKDGYILKVFRIVESVDKKNQEGKPVVFLQHGMMANSDIFV